MNSEAVKYMRSQKGREFIREFGSRVLGSPIGQYFILRHATDIDELRAQDTELKRQLGRAPFLHWAIPAGTYRHIDVNDLDQDKLMTNETFERFRLIPYGRRTFAAKNGFVSLYYVSDDCLGMSVEKN